MSERTAIVTPPRKAWAHVALWAALSAPSVAALLRGDVRIPGLLLFGTCFVLALVRAVRHEPVVELQADGFVHRTVGLRRRFMRWHDVATIRVSSFFGPTLEVEGGGQRVRVRESRLPVTAVDLARLMERAARDAGRAVPVRGPAPVPHWRRRLELGLFAVLAAVGVFLAVLYFVGDDSDGGTRPAVTVVLLAGAAACAVFAGKRRRPSAPPERTFRL